MRLVPLSPPKVVPRFTIRRPPSPYSRWSRYRNIISYATHARTLLYRLRFQLKLGRTRFRARRRETLVEFAIRAFASLALRALIIDRLIN